MAQILLGMLNGFEELPAVAFRVAGSTVQMLLWTEGKIIRRLAAYICSIEYLHLPYSCLNLFFFGIMGTPVAVQKENIHFQLARAALTIGMMALLAWGLRKIPRYLETLRDLQTKYFLVGSVCALAASLIQFYMEEMDGKGDSGLTFMVLLCMVVVCGLFYGLGVGFVILDIFRKKYKAESRLKDEYLQITRDYVRVIGDNSKEIRKMHHDLQAHVGSLKYYMERKEYQKAEAYLDEMQEHVTQRRRKMVSVNHEIVDAVLLEIQVRAEELQIQWQIEGIFPSVLSISDFDLCTIFSNLLSNSLEACEKVQKNQRYIRLSIRQFGNHLVVELMNPVMESVEIDRLGTMTTKEKGESHGYGVANVKAAVEKNHGEIFFENQGTAFVTRILFSNLSCCKIRDSNGT